MDAFKLVKNEDSSIRNHSDEYSIKNYLTKDFNKDFSLAVSEYSFLGNFKAVLINIPAFGIENDRNK